MERSSGELKGPVVLIRGGNLVTERGTRPGDLLIRAGRIVASGTDLDSAADQIVDARGCFVMPGGIDAHTHIQATQGPHRTIDTFASGTQAAVSGGTTTVIDFALQKDGQLLDEALIERIAEIESNKPYINVGLHIIIRDCSVTGWFESLIRALELGASDVKLYLAHRGTVMLEDDDFFVALRAAASLGMLALVHAENGRVVDLLRQECRRQNLLQPRWHRTTRPPGLEAEAVQRAIELARLADCKIYLVHLSSAEAVAALRAGRERYSDVWAETCPQYLVLNENVLLQDPLISSRYVCSPPLREEAHQVHLWKGINDGVLSTVASDHSAFALQRKVAGADNFLNIPAGLPGVAERLSLMYHFGVQSGRISMSKMVEVLSASPARLFGLEGKGDLRIGADADIVVFDPTQAQKLSKYGTEESGAYSAYEGITVRGAVDSVLLGGRIVHRHGVVVGEPTGSYIPRRPIGNARQISSRTFVPSAS